MHICCLSWASAVCSGTNGADFALYLPEPAHLYIYTDNINQLKSKCQ